MKNIYLIIGFVLANTTAIYAQTKDTKTADKRFKQMEYVAAAKAYLELVDQGKTDGYTYKQLGECYYNMFNSVASEKWYEKAMTSDQDAESYYRYAQMLKANGKYEVANKAMQSFAEKAPKDQRAKSFKENPNYLPQLIDAQKNFDISEQSFNSDKSEFGAFLTNDNNIYFASSRSQSKRTDGWNKEPYLDVYRAILNADGSMSMATEVKELNTKWHDGPVCISADGQTMYFSRDSHADKMYEKDKDLNTKFGQVNLYRATLTDGIWGNITGLPFNSKSYSSSNPSVSKDQKTLYFNSNMPGGKGGNDIWKVSINDDGTYGTPENLGDKVNTEGSEQFAFISDDNQLYFASNGKPGFGGLDIFVLDLNKNTVAKNLGKPVNSEKDDFSFSYNTAKKMGFFSSNRAGTDDIFGANPICKVQASIAVNNKKTKAAIVGAKVAILDENQNIIATKSTDSNGMVDYTVECDRAYNLQVSQAGFENGVFVIEKTKKESLKVSADINPIEEIIKEKEIVLNEIKFDYDKSNITKEGAFELDKLVQVMQEKPSLVVFVKSHTDNHGSEQYNQSLSDHRAIATVQYVISKGIDPGRISGKGYGKTNPKIDCKELCTEVENAQNRRSEFLIVK